MNLNNSEEADEWYGRMVECCQIALAIETGQFKTLEEVLLALKARSAFINGEFKSAGLYPAGDARAKLERVIAEDERIAAGFLLH
jgi:hypothetical protein